MKTVNSIHQRTDISNQGFVIGNYELIDNDQLDCILFKFKRIFSDSKNIQQFYHTVIKLNASLDVVS